MSILPTSRHNARRRGQRGVSMIEVLVTIMILSFGLIGMSALQARALKGSVSSFQRAQAVVFAQYLLDVMRIDRENAKGGSYNLTKTCSPTAIAGTTLANNTLRSWISLLKDDLGAPDDVTTCARVECDADYKCTVVIYWDDSRAGGLDAQSVTVNTRV